MPELPEVETTRRKLAPLLIGRRIESIEHADPGRYRDTKLAHGRTIATLGRRGKYLLAGLGAPDHPDAPPLELIIHLGMTGGFRPQPGPLTRVTLRLHDGSAVHFQDARRFGCWAVVPKGDYASMPTLATMGPEPLEEAFRFDDFARAAARAGAVKPWLLSQVPVAGLGNIYADEALWRAQIHPLRSGLDRARSERLFHAIREVLGEAVAAGGSTLSDYTYAQPDGEPGEFQTRHNVYDREGQPCARCGAGIRKIVVGGRGTHFCPSCQRVKRPAG